MSMAWPRRWTDASPARSSVLASLKPRRAAAARPAATDTALGRCGLSSPVDSPYRAGDDSARRGNPRTVPPGFRRLSPQSFSIHGVSARYGNCRSSSIDDGYADAPTLLDIDPDVAGCAGTVGVRARQRRPVGIRQGDRPSGAGPDSAHARATGIAPVLRHRGCPSARPEENR